MRTAYLSLSKREGVLFLFACLAPMLFTDVFCHIVSCLFYDHPTLFPTFYWLYLFSLCHWPDCLLSSDIFHQIIAPFLLTQVARTITNMQQQIQQHQRQLYQALLMKQQQQQLPSHSSSSSSAGLHPPGGPVSSKSILDPFTGSHQASGLADSLHTKEPPSSPNTYNTYPLCKAGQHQCCGLTMNLKAIIINNKKEKSIFKQQLNKKQLLRDVIVVFWNILHLLTPCLCKQLDWIQTWM